jgi:hypothetical protein
MKKLIYLTLLVFSTSSFATVFDATKNERKTMKITWEVAKDVNKACAAEHAKHGSKLMYQVDACAVWHKNTCKIITKKKPTEEDVGHEIRHCFQGHFH